MKYPTTPKGKVTDNYFGISVPDPYRVIQYFGAYYDY